MGARQVEVWVDSRLVFTGEVDKGCANQVFDYATTVTVDGTLAATPAMDNETLVATPAMDNVSLFQSVDADKLCHKAPSGDDLITRVDS